MSMSKGQVHILWYHAVLGDLHSLVDVQRRRAGELISDADERLSNGSEVR